MARLDRLAESLDATREALGDAEAGHNAVGSSVAGKLEEVDGQMEQLDARARKLAAANTELMATKVRLEADLTGTVRKLEVRPPWPVLAAFPSSDLCS